MKLSPRYTLILTAVGILLAVVILAVVLVLPQFGRLAEVETQISTSQQQADEAQALLEQRQAAKRDAAATDAQLLELAAALPENPDLPSLIIELQDVAYECNVQLRLVEPQPMTSGDGFVSVPLGLRIWGNWADSVEFIQRLQKLTRQVRVVDMTTDVLGEGDLIVGVEQLDPYSVESQIVLETYVIPSANATGTAVPPAPAAP